MTKIDDSHESNHVQTAKMYRNDLMKNTLKFQNSMDAYLSTTDETEKTRLKSLMKEQLGLIQAAVKEIKTRGLHKEDIKLEADYHKFIEDPTGENVSALAQDIETIREHVAGEDPPSFGIRG